jgi:hypothetical protein
MGMLKEELVETLQGRSLVDLQVDTPSEVLDFPSAEVLDFPPAPDRLQALEHRRLALEVALVYLAGFHPHAEW